MEVVSLLILDSTDTFLSIPEKIPSQGRDKIKLNGENSPIEPWLLTKDGGQRRAGQEYNRVDAIYYMFYVFYYIKASLIPTDRTATEFEP